MANVANVLQAKPKKEAISTGLSDAARSDIADALQSILGSTYRLLVKTQIHHWNVVGPLFHPIHVLTEEHYENMFEAVDTLAERIRALGHPTAAPVIGTEKGGIAAMTAQDLLSDLVADHESLCRDMREAAAAADEAGDLVTADMLVERLTFHEKAIWMLRAMLAA